MSLTISVTKKAVSKTMDGLWNITLNLSCADGATKVIDQDFSMKYRTGQDPEVQVKKIQGDMQAAISEYKAEQVLMNHAKLDSAVTYLNANLVG